jgi:uncharacterized protein (TIGR04255 family)
MSGAGHLEWLLRIEEAETAVHCTRYTRWDDVWAQARRFLGLVFGQLSPAPPITHLGLRYIDRFFYEGERAACRADLLLRTDSDYLTRKAHSSGVHWHVHSGWFDSWQAPWKRCLNQLNVGAADVEDRLAVTIDHNNFAELLEPLPVTPSTLESGPIAAAMETMHRNNKAVLANLLIPEMARQIRLTQED